MKFLQRRRPRWAVDPLKAASSPGRFVKNELLELILLRS